MNARAALVQHVAQVEFARFLTWNLPTSPGLLDHRDPAVMVPPAVWAYLFGHTPWCPPKGTM